MRTVATPSGTIQVARCPGDCQPWPSRATVVYRHAGAVAVALEQANGVVDRWSLEGFADLGLRVGGQLG
jgi:hypothetical protein